MRIDIFEKSREGRIAYMGLVMVVFVVQHEEGIGLFYTVKVVSCEFFENHFHFPQSSFDLLLVLALKFGLYSLIN